MNYDTEKVDQAVLALLLLTLHEASDTGGRVWRGHDWEALKRLHEKGYISNPVSKAKSLVVTREGLVESTRLFAELFGTEGS